MIIYYRTITIWCKWPWKDVVDRKYCEFSTSKRKFEKNKIDFTCEPNSDLETKRKAVQEFLGKKVQTLIKLK